jgi:hypothetical protein
LTGDVTIQDDLPRPARRRQRLGALGVSGLLLLAACSTDGGSDDQPAAPDRGPNRAVPPTLAGGVDLVAVEPTRVLVGGGLAFGAPLPSEELAAEAYGADPEVEAAMARRVFALRDGRLLGTVLVLTLDGDELFDDGVLDSFVRAVVAAEGDGAEEELTLAGRATFRSRGPEGTAIGFLEGDQLVVVKGPVDQEIRTVVQRQLTAIAAGTPGAAEPATPLVPIPIGSVFVVEPTVTVEAIPPPEEEPPPEAPALPGATGLEGRYGVVAGERRTTVWVFTLDPATYPTAEALEPALAALVSSRAGGASAEGVEVVDRVVQRADGAPSARAFRHHGIAILVEGGDPAQVDAVVSAWIAELLRPPG